MDNIPNSIFKEGNNSTLFNSKKKSNSDRKAFSLKMPKGNVFPKFYEIANFILPGLILMLLPIQVNLASNYIELQFNNAGLNQYLSDQYTNTNPSYVYVNNIPQNTNNKKVTIGSINDKVKLDWQTSTLTDFSNMFSGLTNIISITMNFNYGKDTKMSYMLKNCINLVTFTCNINYEQSHIISDMREMFYNCQSLISFDFSKFYLNSYASSTGYSSSTYYNNIDLSYMFYNCKNLETITKSSYQFKYISNMRGMFSNCISLTTIDLGNFEIKSGSKIDLSYTFYNCQNLETIKFPSSSNSFGISNMEQIFYNCQSLKQIDLRSFSPSSSYLNFSSLFFNCFSLTTVTMNSNNFYISDTREMFYNCSSLNAFSFNPYWAKYGINMAKMFYNCTNIKSITFQIYKHSHHYNSIYIYYYFNPVDISYMFYNCKSLISLTLDHFKTNNTKYINHMFYNCRNLKYLYLDNSNFDNSFITSMKGVFENCESIVSLNLKNFYTPKVEIMWNMFKGCSHLTDLNIKNFDTSKVTDMQSMFEGCSNIISLNLNHFKTSNVQYMNKMFQNCVKLEVLNFAKITSESLGTMHRMFYNCQNLKYLNLFSLTEDIQSITEMLEGTSDNFQLCIYDEQYIPNIFKVIYNKQNTIRDCSSNCYGVNKNRLYGSKKKQCCQKYEFDGICYDKCPSRTMVINITNKCENFTCDYFYNYEQDNCSESNNIPVGYYLNDTNLKTIDKCNENCKTCIENATYCLTCDNNLPFLYLHKCYSSCKFGYYIDNDGISKCECFEEKCFKCSEQSLELGLCELCNEGYYPKFNETSITNNNFTNCFREADEFYLDLSQKLFMPCYPSCKNCDRYGNKKNHFCTSCNSKNEYPIPMIDYENDENNNNYINCYPNCTYNYYFDEDFNYICLNTSECPPFARLLIDKTKQCTNKCNDKHRFEFRNKCFEICPPESISFSNSSGDYCNSTCPFERPFEMVAGQICVSTCTIMERYYKLCVTNYEGNLTNEVQDMVLSDIKSDIDDTFNYTFINTERNVIIDENNIIYEITSTQCENRNPKATIINLGDCEAALKIYYGIEENEPLYILKVDAFVEGKVGPKVEYEIYYPFDGTFLRQLDLAVCDGIEIFIGFPVNLTGENLDLYNKDSAFYNDICYPYTNSKGADITLEDRQNEFVENNRSLCEENCNFGGYDEKTGSVKCSCQVKSILNTISHIKVDKNKLYKFMNIKNIINFKVMKCFKLLFSKRGFIINIGFYCFFPTIIVYITSIIIFYVKEFESIKIQINEIVYAKKNKDYFNKKKPQPKLEYKPKKIKKSNKSKIPVFQLYLKERNINLKTIGEDKYQNIIGNKKKINENKEKKVAKGTQNEKKNKELFSNIFSDNLNSDSFRDESKKNFAFDLKKPKKSKPPKPEKKIKNAPPLKKLIKNTNKIQIEKNIGFPNLYIIEPNSKPSSKNVIIDKNILETKKTKVENSIEAEKQKIKEILELTEAEINDLGYKNAIKYDHRTFFQYYFSLLKTKHIIFQIFNKKDYNSQTIKILLLFYNFVSCYAINALFFNDDTMHQIYEDDGDFNIIYQLPQIIYSTVISFILDIIINSLALSQDDIIELKKEKNLENFEAKGKRVKEMLRLKSIAFYILNFILILVFGYYLGCFCAVYKNTQYHLIKDTLISYGVGILTPFGTDLLPGLFRMYSLRDYTPGKKILYKISKFIQNFL